MIYNQLVEPYALVTRLACRRTSCRNLLISNLTVFQLQIQRCFHVKYLQNICIESLQDKTKKNRSRSSMPICSAKTQIIRTTVLQKSCSPALAAALRWLSAYPISKKTRSWPSTVGLKGQWNQNKYRNHMYTYMHVYKYFWCSLCNLYMYDPKDWVHDCVYLVLIYGSIPDK